MRAIACLTLILGGLFGGCATAPATRTAPPLVPADSTSTPTTVDAKAASDAGVAQTMARQDAGASAIASVRSSLIFSNITGVTGDQTAVLFTPTAQAIEACRGSRGGKLVVRLHTEKRKLVAEPQVGSSLDPAARQCVLDALTASQIDESSNLAAGAMVRPTGFTSLLTIEW
ncbi:MAG: hypothetical protein ABI551_08630 [Polyangiaceae bacterium]